MCEMVVIKLGDGIMVVGLFSVIWLPWLIIIQIVSGIEVII